MKVLLDENLPKKLKSDFSELEAYTVSERGWNGRSNGDLIKLMLAENFDVLLTFDKNLEHQQNFEKFPVCVFALNAPDNTDATLRYLVPLIKQKLTEPLIVGVTEINL